VTAASNSGGRLRLLIGEGPDDAEFFKALIEARGLQTLNYRVMSTAPKGVGAGGNTKFQEALSIVNVKPVFRDICRRAPDGRIIVEGMGRLIEGVSLPAPPPEDTP